jgi:uncharacterized damage-inducible protein DinB
VANARQALTGALARLDGDLARPPAPGEWSPGQVLRHVVWVEYYWTAVAQAMRDAQGPAYDMTAPQARAAVLQAASRLAATTLEPSSEPPPYTSKAEALPELERAHEAFTQLISSLACEDYARCMTGPRGTVTMRYCIEHVIEHDWAHAVQLAGLRA